MGSLTDVEARDITKVCKRMSKRLLQRVLKNMQLHAYFIFTSSSLGL